MKPWGSKNVEDVKIEKLSQSIILKSVHFFGLLHNLIISSDIFYLRHKTKREKLRELHSRLVNRYQFKYVLFPQHISHRPYIITSSVSCIISGWKN
jgi:hypothetical protein